MSRAAIALLVGISISAPARAADVEWTATGTFRASASQVRTAALDALDDLGYSVSRSLTPDEITAHDRMIVRVPEREAEARARLLALARVEDSELTDLRAGSELDVRLRLELAELGERGVRVLIGSRITLSRPSPHREFIDVLRLPSLGVAERDLLGELERRLADSVPAASADGL